MNGAIQEANVTAFSTVKVRQLLFDGYEDPLLQTIKRKFPAQFGNRTTRVALFQNVIALSLFI